MLETPSAYPAVSGRVVTSDGASGITDFAAAATRIPRSFVAAYVSSVRAAHPNAGPAEIAYLLQRRYQFAMGIGGVATGMMALRPMGTVAAGGLTAAHLAGAAGLSSVYLLALCEIYEIDDPGVTRHLLASCALGAEDTTPVEYQLGLGSTTWYADTLARLPVAHVRWAHSIAARQLAKAARKGGVSRSAAVLPSGIGLALGFTSGRLLARRVIDAARAHLGAPPATFLEPIPALFTDPDPSGQSAARVTVKDI